MNKDILALAECRGSALRKTALEATTAARGLADATGGSVHVLLAGSSGAGQHAAVLAGHGADFVHVAESESLSSFDSGVLVSLIAGLQQGGAFRAILVAASVHGREVAARCAARLDLPLASDVTSLRMDGEVIEARHPVNTGKVIATVRVSAEPAVISLRPSMFTPAPVAGKGQVTAVSEVPAPSERLRVTGMESSGGARMDLSEAPVIVSGGRGLKAAENFKLVEDLASAFGNAAVGCTRAVSDDGWRPHSDQIGQTGRVVAPDLYVAVGISGAIQHIAGMRNSRIIVAINKDAEAPIFKVADYGIVGDAFEVLPVLTAAVARARSG